MSELPTGLPEPAASLLRLDDLLRLLVERALGLLHAERCTLFLHDAASGELYSRVLGGGRLSEIRVPAAAGIAGESFTSGEVINIPDAYQDPRFNTGVDARTGFRTRSLLCCPILRPDGSKIGVIQIINKTGGAFSAHDEELIRIFCDQAAITLQNALAEEHLAAARETEEKLARELAENHGKLRDAFRELNERKEALEGALARIRNVRRLSLGVAALIVLLIGGILIGGRCSRPRARAAVGVRPDIVVAPAPVSDNRSLGGVLAPIATQGLPSPFAGRVRAVLALPGQQVRAGDPLIEIDTTQLDVEIRLLENQHIEASNRHQELLGWEKGREVAAARRNLERSRHDLDNARLHARNTRLLFERGVVSESDLRVADDQVRGLVEQASVAAEELSATLARGGPDTLTIARNALENITLELDRKREARKRASLRAPADGVILSPPVEGRERPLEPGRELSEGELVYLLGDLRGFSVPTAVDEADVLKIRPGMSVKVSGDAFPGIVLDGSIALVSSQGRSTNGIVSSFDVVVRIPEIPEDARPRVLLGMTADLSVQIYSNPEALVVPVGVLVPAGEGHEVLVREADGSVRNRPVDTGITTGDGVEIRSGLSAGDKVVWPDAR